MSTADGDGRPTDGDASASDLAAQAAQAAAAAAVEARRRADELARAAAAEQQAGVAVPSDPVPDHSGPQDPVVEEVRAGYAFDGPVVEIGALVVDDVAVPSAPVRIPLGMLNRHGLVAGATGTGKTRTLQLLAEQVSAHGVPVFAADVKGDLSGIAVPGTPSERLTQRCADVGQTWQPLGSPTELLTLGGLGTGVPVRASLESFGPLLLAKVLGLNETQESSLGLVFHHAREQGHRLVDLGDLRSVLTWLVGDGKAELKELGGLSSATVGVILRELVAFADQGADVFFGEPELDVADLLRLAPDGRGVVSLLEVPSVVDRPTLFSTFLLHLLRTLFATLPEVGDVEKPRLVFFFDEAHLLFADASKDFLAQVTQTVRLIRSKGVGIVFVTQTPKDVPSDVLAQLGSRVQHQLRAHTPDDAKALRATVSTYPTSGYDLGELLTRLAIGEAVVTVMDERGAPTPVAWTRLRAPQGSMAPAPADVVAGLVAASPLLPRYGTRVDPPPAELPRRAPRPTGPRATPPPRPDAWPVRPTASSAGPGVGRAPARRPRVARRSTARSARRRARSRESWRRACSVDVADPGCRGRRRRRATSPGWPQGDVRVTDG